MRYLLFILISVMLVVQACNSPYISKKKGYYQIDLPASHTYTKFSRAGFPYQFEYPVYATIVQDSTYFDASPDNNYWINLDFPQYNARVFLSYKKVGDQSVYKVKKADGSYKDSLGINVYERMVNDAFTLTAKNEVVARFIKDSAFVTDNGVGGVYFKVGGDAATASQFFLTDTTTHFLRGALYFNTTPNADSLQPVQEFLQKDIEHFIKTFSWK